jgi:hypothetical protein
MKKDNIAQITVFTFLLVFSSCNSSYWKNEDMKRAISIASFKNPNTTCEVLRVDDSYPGEGQEQNGNSLHGYEIISDFVVLNSASRKELSSIIEDRDTYLRHSVPVDCLFRPGVAFRFSNQQNQVNLLICFSCNELRYYLDGKVVGQSYFKSQELRFLVKELFPKEDKIQKL